MSIQLPSDKQRGVNPDGSFTTWWRKLFQAVVDNLQGQIDGLADALAAITALGTDVASTVAALASKADKTTEIRAIGSLDGGGTLDEALITLALDNDADAPGNNYVYGTDGSGTKGWVALSGVSVGDAATLNSHAGSYYLDRTNHTGTQGWGTITSTPTTLAGYGITDYTEAAQDALNAAFAAGTHTGVTITYNDISNSFNFTVTASGSGDVVGPGSATDNALVLFDGTTGKLIKDSGMTLAALVVDSIADSDTTHAPSRNAVFDALALKQDADSDLTAIAALTPTNDDIIQRKAGAWTNRTMAQIKTDLVLVKADVGLGSVTNDAQTKAAIVPNTAPSAGQILVGNAGGTAYAPVTMSGDATLASTGALTIANGAVTSAKLASMTSAQLAGVLSDETGSGAAVFATAPTLVNPIVGTQTAGDTSTKAASTAYVDNAVGAAGGGGSPALRRASTEFYFCEDFVRGVTTSANSGTTFLTTTAPVAYSNSGSSVFVSTVAGRPGVYELSTASSTTGGPRLFPTGRPMILLGGGQVTFETCINIATLSVLAQRFDVTAGFFNAITGTTRKLTVSYSDNVNSGNWRLAATDSGGTTNVDTAVIGPSAGVWVKVKLVVNAAGTSADLYVDGTYINSIAANIPVADDLAPVVAITKSAGSSARTVDVDYIELSQTFTTPR